MPLILGWKPFLTKHPNVFSPHTTLVSCLLTCLSIPLSISTWSWPWLPPHSTPWPPSVVNHPTLFGGRVLIKSFREYLPTSVNRTYTNLNNSFSMCIWLFELIVHLGICKFGVIPWTHLSKHFKIMFRGINVSWQWLWIETAIFRL